MDGRKKDLKMKEKKMYEYFAKVKTIRDTKIMVVALGIIALLFGVVASW